MKEPTIEEILKLFGIKKNTRSITPRELEKKFKKTVRNKRHLFNTDMEAMQLFYQVCQHFYPAPDTLTHNDIKVRDAFYVQNKVLIICDLFRLRTKAVIEGDPRWPFDQILQVENHLGNVYAKYLYNEVTYAWNLNEYKPYRFITRDFMEGTEFSGLDPYAILGVDEDELISLNKSQRNRKIKAAYRKMVQKWHPDRNKSKRALLMMKKINWAYNKLIGKSTIKAPVARRVSVPKDIFPSDISLTRGVRAVGTGEVLVDALIPENKFDPDSKWWPAHIVLNWTTHTVAMHNIRMVTADGNIHYYVFKNGRWRLFIG